MNYIRTILLGDYNNFSSQHTIDILKKFNLEVDLVKSGSDLIETINKNNSYDLIITNNIYKDGVNSPEIISTLKNIENFNTPVIVLSISENAKEYFIDDLKFDEYIVKPLTEEKILPILQKYLIDF